jgi:hypothetical protein
MKIYLFFFFFILFSFFPTKTQPFINLLVNPVYKMSLSIGLVKHQPIIPLHSSSDIRSLSISPTDNQQDNERRRAIALKALNERWKSLNVDSSKSHLPKSFPKSQTQTTSVGKGSHGHAPHERKVIPKFTVDEILKLSAIPMPPPPGMMANPSTESFSTDPSTSS